MKTFTDVGLWIAGAVADVLDQHENTPHPDLETILQADAWARERVLAAHAA